MSALLWASTEPFRGPSGRYAKLNFVINAALLAAFVPAFYNTRRYQVWPQAPLWLVAVGAVGAAVLWYRRSAWRELVFPRRVPARSSRQ